MEDDDFDPDLVSFTFTGPDYNPVLNEGITIDSIFQVLPLMMLWPHHMSVKFLFASVIYVCTFPVVVFCSPVYMCYCSGSASSILASCL